MRICKALADVEAAVGLAEFPAMQTLLKLLKGSFDTVSRLVLYGPYSCQLFVITPS